MKDGFDTFDTSVRGRGSPERMKTNEDNNRTAHIIRPPSEKGVKSVKSF